MGPEDHLPHRLRLQEERERLLTSASEAPTGALLPTVFPACVATAEVVLNADEPLTDLLPEEAEGMRVAIAHRAREYRAGRHCARLALSRLGVHGVSVPRGQDRAPVWPAGVVGSITHTQRAGGGFCGAAVCRTGEVRALGLDAELDSPLEAALQARIMDQGELSALRALGDPGELGKVIFSAKECVYKAQYPLSGQFLEFREVRLELDLAAGRFRGVLLRQAGPLPRGTAFDGAFVRARGLILTAIAEP